MKKILSIITVAALCAQTADMQAMDAARKYAQQAKTEVNRAAQQTSAAVQKRMASARMKKEAFVNWAAPFLSEVGAALRKRDFNALPGIVQKYKAQSVAAGVIAAAILTAIGLMIRVLVKSEQTVQLPLSEQEKQTNEYGLGERALRVANTHNVNLKRLKNKELLRLIEIGDTEELKKLYLEQWRLTEDNVVDWAAIQAALQLTDELQLTKEEKDKIKEILAEITEILNKPQASG